jgi:outer membrane biosynthesis protein TonB
MKRPLTYSALLHITVLVLLLVGFYNPFQRTKPLETPIMIEFVQVGEQSAAPVLAPEVIQDVPPKPEPPKPTPPQPQPEPQPEPKPEPPKPEPAPEPQPEPEPVKPEPKPEPQPEPKPVEAEPIPDPNAKKKPKEKPKEEKPKLQKAEITLDKKKKSAAKTDDKSQDKKKKPSKSFDDLLSEIEKSDDGAPSQGKGAPASTIGPVLTASEKDALSRHMARCWLIPAGLRDARDIRVPIKINVARDGTVQRAEIVDKGRMTNDLSYRTAAESARRAVLDPRCSPLPIPQDKYEMFKEFIFNFDPKEMF